MKELRKCMKSNAFLLQAGAAASGGGDGGGCGAAADAAAAGPGVRRGRGRHGAPSDVGSQHFSLRE